MKILLRLLDWTAYLIALAPLPVYWLGIVLKFWSKPFEYLAKLGVNRADWLTSSVVLTIALLWTLLRTNWEYWMGDHNGGVRFLFVTVQALALVSLFALSAVGFASFAISQMPQEPLPAEVADTDSTEAPTITPTPTNTPIITPTPTIEKQMIGLVREFISHLERDSTDEAIDILGSAAYQQLFTTPELMDKRDFYFTWQYRDTITINEFHSSQVYEEPYSIRVDVTVILNRPNQEAVAEHRDLIFNFVYSPEQGLQIDSFEYPFVE